MIGAFRATWIKLSRPAVVTAAAVAAGLFAVMMTLGTFFTANLPGGSRLNGPPLLLADMGVAGMPGELIDRMVEVLGTVALSIGAAVIAADYATGALRTQLVRQPRRLVWLGGTALALASFVVILVVAAGAVVLATAFAAANVYHVPTQEWTSSAAVAAAGSSTGRMILALLGYTALGTALAMLLRSAIAAIGVGLVLALVDLTIASLAPVASPFLPVQVLNAVSLGGTSDISLAYAVTGTVLIIALVAAASSAVFVRRDITE
ncbi:hypothetical protein ACIP88_37220 [Streptomyces uncialis]|uniref:hypothetical protein n=1 Tax=Streptomyces uncialis TaxID=1048205 RepID=UPI003827DB4D